MAATTMITEAYQVVLLNSNVTILLQQHLYMAEKDDRENLGDDFGQRQRLFLLELSSAHQDRVPSPGIAFAQLIQSNDPVSDIHIVFSFLFLTVSAPPKTGPAGAIKKSVGLPRSAMQTSYLGRLQKPHFLQCFLPWTVEDRPRQEIAQ